jgi:hypothetical protein
MKKKINPKKVVPFKSGNPPRQTKKAKLMLETAGYKASSKSKDEEE